MSIAPENSFRAIGLKLIAVLLFVVMAALIKAASAEVPPGEAVFFRSFFAMPVIVLWLLSRGELRTGLNVASPKPHIIRGVVGVTAMGLSFTGLAILPLYEVKAIQYAMPLFVVVLAAIYLKETVRKVRLTAVGLGLVGVLIILWPRLSGFGDVTGDSRMAIGALVVLTSSLFAAFTQVYVRKMVETENAAAIVFWFSLIATSLSLLTMPFGWVLPSAKTAGFLVAAGVIGGTAQILVTNAYRYGDASVIAPFEYASMLFAVGIGYVVFAELPTVQMLAGAALVIAAGVLIIFREHQLRLQRGKARRHVSKYG